MARTLGLPCAAALAIALALPVVLDGRQNTAIKLATIAPDNSPWTGAIRSMGASWAKATEKRVLLTVFRDALCRGSRGNRSGVQRVCDAVHVRVGR